MAYPGIKLFDLHGRTALITGGSKGLGKVIAAGLASAGANVVLCSRGIDDFALKYFVEAGVIADRLEAIGPKEGDGQSTTQTHTLYVNIYWYDVTGNV